MHNILLPLEFSANFVRFHCIGVRRAKEVDFVVCDKDKALELIQVAYEIDTQKSFNRETSALVQAAGSLHCDNLTLIAFSPTRDIVLDGKTIHVVSAIDWLLS